MIDISLEQADKIKTSLHNIERKVPSVVAKAINRSAEAAKTQAKRSIGSIYTIKSKDVASAIKIKKAYASKLSAELRSRGPTLKLTTFKVTPNNPKNGAKLKISVKKGSRKPINGAFIGNMNSGHNNVFTRVSKKRLPIKGHYGPSVPQMLSNDEVIEQTEKRAYEVLNIRLDHEINRALGG